jgi:hypothetical protein
LTLVLFNTKILSYFSKLINTQTLVDINLYLEDLLWGVMRNLLN